MNTHLNILLIEDDSVDIDLVRHLLAGYRQHFTLTVVEDGAAALAFLRGERQQSRWSQPHLILLDLALPRMDGFTFLAQLRQDPLLRTSIVFVLTNSTADIDKAQAYRAGIAGYFCKATLGASGAPLASFLAAYSAIVTFPPTTY